MRAFTAIVAAGLLAGCISPAPREPACWIVEPSPPAQGAVALGEPKFDSVRLSRIEVCAPYDGRRLAVLRHDGSLAFDPQNSFAASPAAILEPAAFALLSESGVASSVIAARSSASAAATLEIMVTRFALDCRVKDSRQASVALCAVMVKNREVVSFARTEAAADAASGNFSQAFSTAFSKALIDAIGRL